MKTNAIISIQFLYKYLRNNRNRNKPSEIAITANFLTVFIKINELKQN